MDIKTKIMNAVAPQQTRTYTPISHNEIISTIHDYCRISNLKVVDEKYMTDKDCNQVTGKLTLDMGDDTMGAMIGFQNSYNKTLSAKFAIGASVFICSNGMVVGDFAFKSKHQGDARYDMLYHMGDAIKATKLKFSDSVVLREDMKKIHFSEKSLHELIGKLFMNQDILRATQINMFQQEYNKAIPKYDYGVSKNNLWNIYNLCTDTIERKSHPSLYFNQHEKLTNLIKETYLN